MRTRALLPAIALGFAGCGGSDGSSNPGVTGGGGKIADYVGTYTGSVYDLPTSSPPAVIATVALTVAADGTVVCARHDIATDTDVTLSGTLTAEGTLSLKGSGASGPTRIQGSLSKRSSGAVATFAESEAPSTGELARYYVLSGGSSSAGTEPRTKVKPDSFLKAWAATYQGTWSSPQAGQGGALRLAYSSSGRVKGTWTDADGTVRTVSGSLNEVAEAPLTVREIVRGRLTLSAKGLAPRLLDVRLTFLADIELPPLPLVGTATDVGGTGA